MAADTSPEQPGGDLPDRHVVVRNIARPAVDVVARLAEAGVSTVHEAIGPAASRGPACRRISGTRA